MSIAATPLKGVPADPADPAARRRRSRMPCPWSVTTMLTGARGSPPLASATASIRATVAAPP